MHSHTLYKRKTNRGIFEHQLGDLAPLFLFWTVAQHGGVWEIFNVLYLQEHNCLITDKYHSIVCMFHIFSSLSRCKAFILFPLPSYCESIVQVSEEWDVVSFDIGPGAVNQCHVVTFFGF